jgi:hypothetical protein
VGVGLLEQPIEVGHETILSLPEAIVESLTAAPGGT